MPGEPGYETWPKEAYKTAGGANNWSGMSIDFKRGLVFASLGSPSYDFYGADRPGKNLYGNCVLALDCRHGKVRLALSKPYITIYGITIYQLRQTWLPYLRTGLKLMQ